MTSNFLAESVDLFLNNSQLTTIVSEEQGSDNFGIAEFGKPYAMRLKMFRTYTRGNLFNARTQDPAGGSTYFGGYMPPQQRRGQETLTMYSRPSAFGPPVANYRQTDQSKFFDSRNGFNPVYTPPYYDGEAWIDFIWKAPEAGTAAQVAGQTTGKFTLSQILSNVTASAMRFSPGYFSNDHFNDIEFSTVGPLDTFTTLNFNSIKSPVSNQFSRDYNIFSAKRLNFNSMQLFASVNPLQTGRVVSRDLENDTLLNENIQQVIEADKGATNARWVIQTKFETPILNFKDVDVTTPTAMHNCQTPRGMWHQYGVIPNNNQGIYLQVQDLPSSWLKFGTHDNQSQKTDWHLTGSLADVCGFSQTPVKLGQIAQGRIVREAVVAIPYIEESGIKKFFEISQDNYLNAKRFFQATDIVNKGGNPSALGLGDPEFFEKRSGASVIDQIKKMKRYVFPPSMDFVTYSDITPFAMYIFEFEHTFTQQDLVNIWQGLPPEIGTEPQISADSVSNKLLANELLGNGAGDDRSRIGKDLNTEIRWMVFKVKQRAKTNYFDKVIGKKAGYGQAATAAGFSTNAQSETAQQSLITYNWPYDFFSLVELVKIDAEVEFSNIPEGKFEPKQTTVPDKVQQFAANLSGRRRR